MNDKNKKVNIDNVSFKLIYNRNKDFLLSVIAIFLSVFLFFQFVLPQISELQVMSEEEKAVKERIEVLNYNFQFFNQMDSQNLDQDLLTASTALPLQKDFAGVLVAVSQAAGAAGVGLDDFSFRVGDLSTPSGVLVVTQIPAIEIELTIRGDIIKAKGFIQKLSQALPLSDVVIVQTSGQNSTIAINFYYRPFPPLIKFDDKTKSRDLSLTDKDLLTKLTQWRNNALVVSVNQATPSSQLTPTPTLTPTPIIPVGSNTPTPTLP